jgi:competence protein ComEC
VLVLSCCLGFLLGSFSLQRVGNINRAVSLGIEIGDVSGFTGRLIEDSVLSRDGDTILSIDLSRVDSRRGLHTEARGRVLTAVKGDWRFSMGQILSIHGRLAPSTRGAEGFVAFVGIGDIRSRGYARQIWLLRAALRETLNRSAGLAGYPASALIEALLIGSREDIPADLSEGFMKTGSLHVLSLSGLNVAVIYGFLGLLLGFVRGRALKFLLGTAALAFYQFLAGPIPSLLRATIMLVVGGIGLILDRDGEPLNLLCVSGIAILLVDPTQLWSLSFQLSFLAMTGILAVGPVFARPFQGRVPPGLLAALAASAGAQFATLPVVATSFGAYYPSGFIASLLLVPLVTLFLWLGLLWIIVSPLLVAIGALQPASLGMVSSAAAALHHAGVWIFGRLYTLISAIATGLSRIPGISIPAESSRLVAAVSALCVALIVLFPVRLRGYPQPARGRARA